MWQRMNLFHRSSSLLVYLWSSQAWHCQPQHFSNSQGVVFLSAPPFLLPLLSKLILSLFYLFIFLHVLQGREERWRVERKWEKQKREENERRQGVKGRLRDEERKSEEKRRWVEEKQKRGWNDRKHGEESKQGKEGRWKERRENKKSRREGQK